MSKQYFIQWKSKVNGRAGKGTKVFDREAAEHLVAELNAEYPEIEHHATEAGEEPPPPPSPEGELSEPATPPAPEPENQPEESEHNQAGEFHPVTAG